MEIKKLLILGSVFIFVVMAVLLIVNYKNGINANVVNEGSYDREITIDAKMFEFNPNVIKVKEGERIKLIINSLDVEHSISIPELRIDIHDEGIFVANKKGTFNFYCHTYCGSGHSAMKGVLIVE
ncbi:MAG: cupredoxin domain-containing protein [Nanoarchaeota archaeon]